MSYAIAILGISLLIALHELGHFIMARLCGMRVNTFSIGFGPVLLSTRRGETTYQLAAIPLGGFVQIEGMGGSEPADPNSDHAPTFDPRNYRNRPLWQRALVVFAGPVANWLICAALLTGLAASTGLPSAELDRAILGSLGPNGAAHAAGLQDGDRVVRIGDQRVTSWANMVAIVQAHPNNTVTFSVERDGVAMELPVTPKAGPSGVGVIEAAPHLSYRTYGAMAAVGAGCAAAWDKTVDQVTMLTGMVSGTVQGHLSGLPGIVKAISQEAKHSAGQLFYALAWLSVGLCVLNLLPVPGLDGSHLLFLAVEAIRRRPLNERVEGAIQTAGVVFLLGVMLFVSVRDLM